LVVGLQVRSEYVQSRVQAHRVPTERVLASSPYFNPARLALTQNLSKD